MKPLIIGVIAPCVLVIGLCTSALAQQIEGEPRPAGEPKPLPYLAGSPVDFHTVLAPPPAAGSVWDLADQRLVMELQNVAGPRVQSATLDSAFVYPRFEQAFGRPIDRTTSPALITLLNRALRDVSFTTFEAKGHFQRARPFQRFQLERWCGDKPPPKPEPHPVKGSSYPSGHSAYGWAVAMILARVAPERSRLLLARAAEYAESRVVCGAHYPSDVNAGHAVAAAVVSRLDASEDFQADLLRARTELAQNSE